MTEIASPPGMPASSPEPREPAPVPNPAWVEAEAEVRALAATIDAAVRTQWQGWTDRVSRAVLTPLGAAARQAASAHRRLVTQAALEDEAMPAADLWQRVNAYREGVGASVLAPLRAHLARQKIGDTVGIGYGQVLDSLAPLAAEALYNCTLPRPVTLYAPAEQDRLLRRMGKGLVRARYALRQMQWRLAQGARRLFRQELESLRVPGRLVPLRDLLAYHVHVRLPGVLDPCHEAVQRHTAGQVGRLEAALTDWTHAVLDVERRLNQATFHQAPVLQGFHAGAPPRAPEEPAEVEVVHALVSAAGALQQALNEVGETAALPDDAVEAVLQQGADALEEDLSRAGTFLLKLSQRTVPAPEARPAAKTQARSQHWVAWHDQVVNRLDLNSSLLMLRKETLRLNDALIRRVSEATLGPVEKAFKPLIERLQRAEKQVSEACDAALARQDLEALSETLRGVQRDSLQAVQDALSNLPGLVWGDQALAEPGRREWDMLARIVERLPESLRVHTVVRAPEALVPEQRPWRLDIRTVVQDMLDPFAERLTESAEPLHKQIVTVWGETEQVSHIVQYNLDAALEELTQAAKDEAAIPATEEPASDPVANARELATDGLRRAAAKLEELARSLEAPWQVLAQAVFEVFRKDWIDIHQGLRTEAFAEEQWFDLRLRVRRRSQRLRRYSKELRRRYTHEGARLLRFGRRQARDLIERGRSAVGAVDATEEERLRAIDTLAPDTIGTLHSRLPLVYRKLFSFDPVLEPVLLDGRAGIRGRVGRHFERWKTAHATGALILALPLGSGRTSLLNVLRTELGDGADVRMLSLDERLFDPSDFAVRVAEALGLEMEEAVTLEALEARLLAVSPSQSARICLIDNLEHLLLRAPEGTRLIECVLTFLARTDAHVYWLATMGLFSWRFIERIVGPASSLVTAYQLEPLDGRSLETIILNRHRRSGLSLRFSEPKDLSPVMRQRLRRAKREEARQTLLREHYFDRLFKLSGQNVMLALYYWLRCVDFETEEGTLIVQPLEPISFKFFQSFDLAHAFTLKAFLLHNTLTLKEHNRIFRMNDAESTYILESLLNLRLIEPTDAEARRAMDGFPGRLMPQERYGLHPLVLHPVFEFLREKNIAH